MRISEGKGEEKGGNATRNEGARSRAAPTLVQMAAITSSFALQFQADNIVLKERKLNIAPAIKKTVCIHFYKNET